MTDLKRLQKALDHTFSDSALLQLALTHRSAGSRNNERLEFLGDSILNHIIAEDLYQRFPRATEGELSRMRSRLVNGETLADLARELELGEYMRLGSGERKSGGHRRSSILADGVEALFGAILLDSDVEHCRAKVLALLASRLEKISSKSSNKDAKTRLQEYLQGRSNPLPDYELVRVDGKDHAQTFFVQCSIETPALVVEGSGSSRRRAEQAAAATALDRLLDDAS